MSNNQCPFPSLYFFISYIIIKIFTKHFLTIIYSKKSHIFALGPDLHKNCFRSDYNKKKPKGKTKNEKNDKTTQQNRQIKIKIQRQTQLPKKNNAAYIYTLPTPRRSAGHVQNTRPSVGNGRNERKRDG